MNWNGLCVDCGQFPEDCECVTENDTIKIEEYPTHCKTGGSHCRCDYCFKYGNKN